MKSYVDEIINLHTVYEFMCSREIITDRMGPWENQYVTLTWEGRCEHKAIELTPDEVEVLFERGLTKNVLRLEDGKIHMKTIFLDDYSYVGAIVCGILAPNTLAHMREGIIEYAKKIGYISEEMTPVEMTSGTKALIFNTDGTYDISFKWNEKTRKTIESGFLRQFTSCYFRDFDIFMVSDGVILKNLSEDNVFSKENIDIIRKYDIQLRCLDPQIDRKILLQAIMQRAFISLPQNILSKEYFNPDRVGNNITIPNKCKKSIHFNKFGIKHMMCGTVSYDKMLGTYVYSIDVPYSEYIRELMLNAKKIIEYKYGIHAVFLPFRECIDVSSNKRNKKIEKELIILDYAIKLLHIEKNFNHYQLYDAIISLLEADASGTFKKEYFSTLKMLKDTLPEKLY